MKAFHIPRGVLFLVLFVLVVFAVLYRPIDLKALVRASSQSCRGCVTSYAPSFGSSVKGGSSMLSSV